jgi:uncharacterized protein (TIGR02996 family)
VSDRAALASAILDNLDADTPRLVFADWLDEHDEGPRAEFIRTQIEAARLPKARTKSEPEKRANALLRKHGKAWAAALGLPEYSGEYVRGFLTNMGVDYGELLRLAPMLAVEPFTLRLDLSGHLRDGSEVTPAWMKKLAANPVLRTVTEMDSETGGFGAELTVPLFKSKHLRNLWKFTVFEDNIGSKGVKAIAESPSPFVLRHLCLNSGIGAEDDTDEQPDTVKAVKVLASHPRFEALERLGLQFNSLGAKCAELLAASQTLSAKLVIGLAASRFDSQAEARLKKRFKVRDFA